MQLNLNCRLVKNVLNLKQLNKIQSISKKNLKLKKTNINNYIIQYIKYMMKKKIEEQVFLCKLLKKMNLIFS